MADRRDEGDAGSRGSAPAPRRRIRKRRIAAIVGLSILLLLLIAIAGVWIARRPIASNVLEAEFERRGVEASYELERVGLRTQVVRNLVIGDPDDPDLVARYALIQLRVRWNGSAEVYRVAARGVRLEGTLRDGRVSWGQLDRLLPPPSGKPFRFPDVAVDVADTSISLRTPAGPLGVALEGNGNLTGGFKGRMALSSPGLDLGSCRLDAPRAYAAVAVTARRPHVEGPLRAAAFACPDSDFAVREPLLVLDSVFAEGFDAFDGRARIAARQLVAGTNGLANLTGEVSFEGDPDAAKGRIALASQASRFGPVTAERTRVEGRYQLGAEAGTLAMAGRFFAEDSTLAGSMLAGATGALRGLDSTPVGPIAEAIAAAVEANGRAFDAQGEIRIVNAPGGGAARITDAALRTARGARITVSGGSGIAYSWPAGAIEVDGTLRMAGGGLPTGEVAVRRRRDGSLDGIARFAPYAARGARLALAPVRFSASPSGAARFATQAQLTGAFPGGRVQDLRLPLTGSIGPSGRLEVAPSCITASFRSLVFRDLSLGPARLPICPAGQDAIVVMPAGGSPLIGARIASPRVSGRLGSSPMSLVAGSARLTRSKDFALSDATLRLGRSESPFLLTAASLEGSFRGSGISGTMRGVESTIGSVPLAIGEGAVDWRFYRGDLTLDGSLTVSDRADQPRFYPLSSQDFRLTLSGNDIAATASLLHPPSGTLVTRVEIAHDLSDNSGNADLDVPGIPFGEQIQPEELTPLTEGVVALVRGTLSGEGDIAWSGDGDVTSTGTFTTAGTDLAAPFGPVTGLSTTIRFTDLLGLETAPGQVASVATINPGILVEDGTIRYQLLRDQLVKIERGEWPFMGGRLVLQETILNFGRPTPKRLTFQVAGFNAKTFIDRLGFAGITITGIFDGVLPMIFDDSGGRIVGGRLDSRPPGGEFAYTGTKPKAGLFAGVAFDLLSNIRYRNMIIRLDGDLAAEFATRVTIEDVSLGDRGGLLAGIARRALRKVPLRVNLNVRGPFRALIQTARGFKDPTAVIAPVMPFPLDTPGIVTQTRVLDKEEEQRLLTPIDEVDVSTEPPPESER